MRWWYKMMIWNDDMRWWNEMIWDDDMRWWYEMMIWDDDMRWWNVMMKWDDDMRWYFHFFSMKRRYIDDRFTLPDSLCAPNLSDSMAAMLARTCPAKASWNSITSISLSFNPAIRSTRRARMYISIMRWWNEIMIREDDTERW